MIRFLTSSPCGRVVPAVFVLMLVAATGVAIQPGTWTAKGDLPDNLYFAATAVVDGTIYVIGGSSGQGVVNSVYANHPPNNDPPSGALPLNPWTMRAPMPTARGMAAFAVVDGKIHVMGGALNSDFTAANTVEVYDPATDLWESRTEMPVARWGAAAAAFDGKIYVMGGGTGDALGERSVFSTVHVYDPAADSWDTAADMPTARGLLSVSVADGLIYAAGGSGEAATSKAFEIYDPAIDMWTVAADMGTSRDCLTTAAVDGKIYAFGGLNWGSVGSARSARDEEAKGIVIGGLGHETLAEIIYGVDAFDLSTGIWEKMTRMPDPRWGLASVVVNGTIHLIGGALNPTLEASDFVAAYDPDLYTTWTEVAAHLEGSYGSQWQTDICAANCGTGVANVKIVLHTENGRHELISSIDAAKQAHFEDVVGAMEVTGKGMLKVQSDQHLRLSGRIYNNGPDGTFGQQCDFRVMEEGFAKGDTVWLVGLRQEDGLFRTNITIANTGIRSSTMWISLFRCNGTEACEFFRTLEADTFEQMLDPFANECGQSNVGWGYATVKVNTGSGVRVSASVIDSRTNDASTVMGKR